MNPLLLLPFFLGALVVFQPLINRLILQERGLAFAALLNASVLFLLVSSFCGVLALFGERISPTLQFKQGAFHWWYVLAGMMGFLLVVIAPLMIKHMGAFSTVVMMLCGQITTSLLWDSFIEGQPVNSGRLCGLLFAVMSAYFSFKPSV